MTTLYLDPPTQAVLSGGATSANRDYSPVNTPINLSFSGTPVTSAAYVQLVASTATRARKVQIFCSSGELLLLAYGAAASESDKIIIIPGGNGLIDLVIPASTRLSVKAVSTSSTTGNLIINFLG